MDSNRREKGAIGLDESVKKKSGTPRPEWLKRIWKAREGAEPDPVGIKAQDHPPNFEPKDPKLSMILMCAHQIRSPLASIQTALNAMRLGYVPGVSGKAVEMIAGLERKSEQLLNFVNDLLNFGRLKSIDIEKEKEVVELEKLLAPILEEFEQRAEQKRIQFQVELIKPLPSVFGHADGLRHLLYNLLDNAFQYTPEGGEISLKLGADPEERSVQGEISDTGMGIPAECLPYIFDEFYRAPNVKKRGIEGSGLGLNIVQWVIQAHQGEIKVKSEEGRGTSFWFAFPLGKIPGNLEEEQNG